MTEAARESADVLLKPCDVTSCDVISCPSPPPCLPLCNQREDEECHHDSKKLEQQKHCNQVQPKKKVKAKGKLVRSMAICEESSPFEEIQAYPDTNISSSCNDNERTSCKEEEQERSTDPKKHSLSKESSVEYTDSTGIDLHQFIVDTLNSNPRDRMMLLKLEQDMIDFITSNSPFKKFPHMSSYHRMLVHRVAAYFGMEHNVDQTGKSVIINRTKSTRIPEQRFLDEVHKDKAEEIHCWKIILKRDSSSDDQTRLHPLREKQSKSMEEREEEYQRARERIFNQEPLCTQESAHAETRAVEEYNPYAETQRKRQLFRGSRDSSGSSWTGSSRQSSTETDCRYSNDPRPWSSTDSDSSYQWTGPAPKPRQPPNHSWEARGAGSISLFRLPSTCPHSSSPPIIEEPAHNSTFIVENGIPPGSILVNPHTGQPFLNPDGSPAVYNPPDSQQPIRSQTQLQGSPSQQQQQQVVQYSSVSYTAPQMLPVTPSQPYSTIEDLSSQFAHVTVNCQSAGEAPPLGPPSQGYIYAAPPPPPPPPNPTSYCQPSPQMPMYYYGQYPTSAQHGCRPVSPSQHIHSQVAQPTAGYAPTVGVQQPSLTQAQAVLGTYSPMASHQCSMVQGGVSMSYPQSKVVTGVGGEAGYCCVVPSPSHHSSCHPPSCSNLSAPAWSAQY
ncbi:cAMP-regulated phosphoprotein 21 isoform X1 [Seriola lalandi dorsalis]|uniref:cAMP-regulated phosphoprotein 21 isoform X1 n=1 Tax=Seriola lalandi dorsalis TaxID=1841481 RepID=UPI000C6FA4B1|nr:cAMP-regulated phosphoprotein 21 isoform X1 [Seriola lalandi dorsalis]XP_023268112.1 cAMP-regulated phosphoprotein 21 isoform X1 [Seriola lalandi dorsalis]XP_056255005.1 cAMP-regulated phosphoprotein 21 isoform X2 [Seriola aureovittata]